jgi:hypothetical protein
VPAQNPAKQISQATWQKIAGDIERLAIENAGLKRTLDELHTTCLAAFDENERMKRLLRDHNIPLNETLS